MASDAPASTSSSISPEGKKLWHAGSLTYTSAALTLLFFWLLWGDFTWQLKERSVPPVVQVLLKQFHSSDLLFALLIGSLASFLSMVLVPIVSYRSDRYRSKWGRRIPYLLIPTPFAVLAMVGLAMSPMLGEKLHRFFGPSSPGIDTNTLLCLGLFWTLFEIATITANAVVGGLINDVVPRELLGRFFGAFRAISLLAAMIFNYSIIGYAKTHYFEIFLGMGAIYAFGFTLMCLRVKEGEYPPPPPPQAGIGRIVRGYFKECYGHAYYRWYFFAHALSWVAFVPVNLYSLPFSNSVQLSLDGYGKCLFTQYLITLLISYPMGILADRLHPLRLGMILQCLYIVVVILGGIFVHDATTFSIALVSQGMLCGCWMTAVASMHQRLLPKAEFSQFASAAGILQSLGTIAVGPLVGSILDHIGHQYRYTYFFSSLLVFISLVLTWIVYRKFMALGGPKNYVAPFVVPYP